MQIIRQVSHVPSLRFCDYCQGRNTVCFRRVVLVVCSDCESGNKSAFEKLQNKLESGTIDPELAVLSILPDCSKVLKLPLPTRGSNARANVSTWH